MAAGLEYSPNRVAEGTIVNTIVISERSFEHVTQH